MTRGGRRGVEVKVVAKLVEVGNQWENEEEQIKTDEGIRHA